MNLKFISAVSFAHKKLCFMYVFDFSYHGITHPISNTQIQAKAEMRNQINQKQNCEFFFCLIIVSWFYRTSCDMMQ